MARTITAIHSELKTNFIANTNLQTVYGFNPAQTFESQFSNVSIENLFLYVVALSIYVLETLFDTHKADVNNAIAQLKPHTLQWYSNKAKDFQYGEALVPDEDYYASINDEYLIVTHSAVTEKNGRLFMKVAKNVGGSLAALSPSEFTSFKEYMERVKDAGVIINYISQAGDNLRLNIDVWYDPLVLDATGKRLDDGTTVPAVETIREFISALPFDGEFIINRLIDALENTDGLDIVTVLNAESKFGANDWQSIDAKVIPEAGYMIIADDDLTINYRANVRS